MSHKCDHIDLYGSAHAADHDRWSRRDFLGALLGASAGMALSLRGYDVFASSESTRFLNAADPDRRLIIVQLIGGNDGFNTVVPVTNDLYYARRPTIAIPKSDTWPVSDIFGMNSATAPLRPLWDDGSMAIIQGVGYPDSSLSHFKATDIWTAATPELPNSDSITGWVGNALLAKNPGFPADQPEDPLAVRVGGPQPLLFQSTSARMGVAIDTPEAFERLASEGTVFDVNAVPPTVAGGELAFVREAANHALSYGSQIYSAAQLGHNQIAYPNGRFADTLAIVSRLIKGGLKTQIYMVQLGGFDTHGGQIGAHPELLGTISAGLEAFFRDIALDGWDDKTLAMTYSEFGRRPTENGSQGTDHGTSAPMFAIGPPVAGGLYGGLPDLGELDERGNVGHTVDFRTVYSTILRDWLGLEQSASIDVLGGDFGTVPFLEYSAKSSFGASAATSFKLHPNYPNPFVSETTILFELDSQEHVRLSVFDLSGRQVDTLVDRALAAGMHTLRFESGDLPSGSYIVRLEAGRRSLTRKIVLAR